ncbi:TetR/AcrR family transcriptional regulator [Amycolatopsis sp. H20-H5]|uniref:TetR/AcrR family transcriptional regulator n=1 Tax=Amycolatopsis sp. H20-H5 TaxID=3046309 RepID=UPI002DB737C1|nr:TetR family transcriptional regulator [Amycolatopsis sp. H20-H5]MEC3979773.1 TetR family transcriptional regulator [Amycolatopsis sp. H20-H5]
MTAEQQVRKRDAAATKASLLDAAAELFAERGFDRTTVRDIAKRAGANQSLLFRYFGTKEALFEEVVARSGLEKLAATPPEQLLSTILRSMLDTDRKDHSLAVFLRSAEHDSAAGAIRRQLGEAYSQALTTLTDSPDAELRADLALAWLLGIGLLREIGGKEPLTNAATEDIVELVLAGTRTLLERGE